jgi:hypothetical protein
MNIFPEEKIETEVEKKVKFILQRNQTALDAVCVNHRLAFDTLWKGDTQSILNVFGTNAVNLFIASSKIQELLSEIYNINGDVYEPLIPPKQYTINEDGTVTIIQEEPIEEGGSTVEPDTTTEEPNIIE